MDLMCGLRSTGAEHARQPRRGSDDRCRKHAVSGRVRPGNRRSNRLLYEDGRQQIPLQRYELHSFIPESEWIRFDKFVPRFTFSGPLIQDRAWFYDGLETEYDNIYIAELPANANSNQLVRGSNLFKIQANIRPSNILTGGVLFNRYHSPYDGISSLTPQQSTTQHNVIAWLPYLRDKWSIAGGALLDIGVGGVIFHDAYEPHGTGPYQITPELPAGSYFENLREDRSAKRAMSHLPASAKLGRTAQFQIRGRSTAYGLKGNCDRAPISYLREDRTLLRRSVFPAIAPFTLNNAEVGAFAQDRWQLRKGLLVEPGLRFDWDEIVRRPLISPRIAVAFSPAGGDGSRKSLRAWVSTSNTPNWTT